MKKYDETFKKMIVEFSESGKSRKQLSEEYGISLATISNWKRQYSQNSSNTKIDSERIDSKELKKENARLREENEVLKKCISIFSVKKK